MALVVSRPRRFVHILDAFRTSEVYHALLYYAFLPIEDPEAFANEHRALCQSLGLKGRILISVEGINGTVSGPVDACNAYVLAVHADPRFAEMPIKTDVVPGHVFQKLFVRVKKELVTFRADLPSDPTKVTGQHLSAAEWKDRIERGDAIILDGRTDYEFDIGHFRGAIRPDVESFREFPTWIREHLGDKRNTPILTYCTGGIRCEKLTSYMIADGFTDVYQLDGGIVTYGKDENVKGALWDGLCYVFDERIAVAINHTEDRRVVGRCIHCDAPTERYINCANLLCNKQHIACEACEKQFEHTCSVACMDVIHDTAALATP
ncbi:MAG: rhodanese-related sulfurtransferase [Candidatus Kapabacteria bacterium]|nr:rhodanese-related sulfurtransferase [Candidatus Kapabacteria bacterium]